MNHPLRILPIGATENRVVFPLQGKATLASVTANAAGAAWGTAVLTVKWSNNPAGPWTAFVAGEYSTATIGPGDGAISWVNVQSKGYLAVEVTTAEGATEDVEVWVVDDSDA